MICAEVCLKFWNNIYVRYLKENACLVFNTGLCSVHRASGFLKITEDLSVWTVQLDGIWKA